MDHEELRERIRALRAKGFSPKEIARATGTRPAVVASLVRTVTAESEPEPIVECRVSPGWSTGLTLPAQLGWPDVTVDAGTEGLANVLVTRKERGSRVTICSYLVDAYCLGVKNVIGPDVMNSRAATRFSASLFSSAYGPRPLFVPLAMAQHFVLGAVEFARSLGFEPHPDFAAARSHLGDWTGPSPITFGRDGKPLYIAGPHDNPTRIVNTLEQSVGQGNFDYMVGVPV
jgi:hypothetical protein